MSEPIVKKHLLLENNKHLMTIVLFENTAGQASLKFVPPLKFSGYHRTGEASTLDQSFGKKEKEVKTIDSCQHDFSYKFDNSKLEHKIECQDSIERILFDVVIPAEMPLLFISVKDTSVLPTKKPKKDEDKIDFTKTESIKGGSIGNFGQSVGLNISFPAKNEKPFLDQALAKEADNYTTTSLNLPEINPGKIFFSCGSLRHIPAGGGNISFYVPPHKVTKET